MKKQKNEKDFFAAKYAAKSPISDPKELGSLTKNLKKGLAAKRR